MLLLRGDLSREDMKAGDWNHLKALSLMSGVDSGCQLRLPLGLLAVTPTHGFSKELLRLPHSIVGRF